MKLKMYQSPKNNTSKRLAVLISTHNNAQTIGEMLRLVYKQRLYLPNWEVFLLVTDEASSDNTLSVVRSYAKQFPELYIVKDKTNKAYNTIFQQIKRQLKADVIIAMNGDLSHDPSLIPYFIDKLEQNYSVVIGSRYHTMSMLPQQWSAFKKA